ncbi:MAG: 6-phosphogluconolactonase [Oscillospiraceae bacterium]|nr:6-phosphogluconolactonase [Oscillospiraceae bacterium]
MKTRVAERDELLGLAAEQLCAAFSRKPDASAALSAHPDCLALYERFSEEARQKELDLSRARFFLAAEFEGLPPDDPHSCRERLSSAFFDPCGIRREQVFFLSADNADRCDAALDAVGRLDLAVLGVGERGRIGFNEPGTPFLSRTHRQKLTKATKRELAEAFGSEELVPDFGWTLGVKTLTEAREILVIALGENRADPVFRMLYARDDSYVPAAFLQLPADVAVYLDTEAANKL